MIILKIKVQQKFFLNKSLKPIVYNKYISTVSAEVYTMFAA